MVVQRGISHVCVDVIYEYYNGFKWAKASLPSAWSREIQSHSGWMEKLNVAKVNFNKMIQWRSFNYLNFFRETDNRGEIVQSSCKMYNITSFLGRDHTTWNLTASDITGKYSMIQDCSSLKFLIKYFRSLEFMLI